MSKRLVVLDVHGPDATGEPLVVLGTWDGVGTPEVLDTMTTTPPEAAALRRLLAQTSRPREVTVP